MAPSAIFDDTQAREGDTSFQRPVWDTLRAPENPGKNDIRCLPDLIDFNSRFNPNHLFALQEERKNGQHVGFANVTFRTLRALVDEGIRWMQQNVEGALPPVMNNDGTVTHSRPVALFLGSDLTHFIYLAVLLKLEVPVVVLSARLSPVAVGHLLTKTEAQAIIVSSRTSKVAEEGIKTMETATFPHMVTASSYQAFQETAAINRNVRHEAWAPSKTLREDNRNAIYFHSSGTTGLPKPIALTQRWLIGFAACHILKPHEAQGMLLSTLPLYHGFGQLAPGISLSTGKTAIFPSSSVIPSASSTVELLQRTGANALMTVPNILEEISQSPDGNAHEHLVPLDFVAVGGGAIKPAVGEFLTSRGVKVLNHYGTTELGAIAPIFVPDSAYDWHYVKLRKDLGLQLNRVEGEGEGEFWKLVGQPFGWPDQFEIQDLLEKNPDSQDLEIKVLGRKDDMIVLATGEKVSPQLLEQALAGSDLVKTAVVFGQHQEEIGVLIEPQASVSPNELRAFIDSVWPIIEKTNLIMDRHARVTSRSAVVVKPDDKVIPRSDKGSVMRNEVNRIFKDDIAAVYEALDKESSSTTSVSLSGEHLEESLKEAVDLAWEGRLGKEGWDQDTDFFESGMDSLEATRLARMLNGAPNKAEFPGLATAIRADLIYRNPSVAKLAKALQSSAGEELSREQKMRASVERYTQEINQLPAGEGAVVLMTGSTGNLGTNLLEQLCRDQRISRIICLNRPDPKGSAAGAKERQVKAFEYRGMGMPATAWEKVEILQSTIGSQRFGLKDSQYDALLGSVTHIIHSAWPMDFQRTLESMESQIRALYNFVELAISIHNLRPAIRPKLIFTSTIAVAARYPGTILPEETIDDPTYSAPMGYGEGKWVCEKMLENAMRSHGKCFQPAILRLGQMTGTTTTGHWAKDEHFPVLLKASKTVGKIPSLHGTYSWLPMDVAARTVIDVTLDETNPAVVYHVENPVRQNWEELIPTLAKKLQLANPNPVPFSDWLKDVLASGAVPNLENFFSGEFEKLSGGGLVLHSKQTQSVSPNLRDFGPVGLEMLDLYLDSWRKHGVI